MDKTKIAYIILYVSAAITLILSYFEYLPVAVPASIFGISILFKYFRNVRGN